MIAGHGRLAIEQKAGQMPFDVITKTPFVYTGTSGDDVLSSRYATAANETFYGYAGNDLIDGGLGADRMFGGAGHDTYVVDNTGDVVVENANEGFDTVRVSFSYTIPVNVDVVELTGAAQINATGSSQNDRLYGNSARNILWGHEGSDILDGRGGNDIMVGGTGSDTYYVDSYGDLVVEYAGQGDEDWVATPLSYTLDPNIESLALLGPGDKDGTGNELDNALHANGYTNVLTGLGGDDRLYAGNGNDILWGGEGDDLLDGDFGDDILTGGNGLDTYDGGYGGDLMVWASANETGLTPGTADMIADFNAAQGDRIDLSLIDANVYANGDQAFTFIGTGAFSGTPGEINYAYVGGDTIIQLQTGTSADVEGVLRLTGIHVPEAGWFAL
jgi:Ca2+-binding RTX toxin-like protein